MLYTTAKINEYYEGYAFRSYVADTAMYIAQNTAHIAGGTAPKNRYVDLIERKIDTRTAEEIVLDVITKTGMEVIDE